MPTYVEDSLLSHVVDSCHGMYSAQRFCERYGEWLVAYDDDGAKPSRPGWLAMDVDICMAGPDGDPKTFNPPRHTGEDYLDAWVSITDDAQVLLEGKRFDIYENEGIFLVRSYVEWCEECDCYACPETGCEHYPQDPVCPEFRAVLERVGIEHYCRKLPAYAWPGGYPLIYVTDDGGVLCPDCVNSELEQILPSDPGDGWHVVAADIHYEGSLCCDHCNADLESAYGDESE